MNIFRDRIKIDFFIDNGEKGSDGDKGNTGDRGETGSQGVQGSSGQNIIGGGYCMDTSSSDILDKHNSYLYGGVPSTNGIYSVRFTNPVLGNTSLKFANKDTYRNIYVRNKNEDIQGLSVPEVSPISDHIIGAISTATFAYDTYDEGYVLAFVDNDVQNDGYWRFIRRGNHEECWSYGMRFLYPINYGIIGTDIKIDFPFSFSSLPNVYPSVCTKKSYTSGRNKMCEYFIKELTTDYVILYVTRKSRASSEVVDDEIMVGIRAEI